jgi:predicted histidine transporter YuiF (NhaC family)
MRTVIISIVLLIVIPGILTIVFYNYILLLSTYFKAREYEQRKQVRDNQNNKEQWLCEEHDKYLEQVTESGMPIWMWDQSVPSINPNN